MAIKGRTRANGEGSIYEDKNGVWWAQRYLPGGGYLRRRSKSHAGAVDKMRELQALASRPKREARDSRKTTLQEFVEPWLARLDNELQPKTIRAYRWVLTTHVLPILGKSKLSEIEHRDVQLMADKIARKQSLGRATVLHSVRVLHTVLEDATRLGIRPQTINPARGVRLPKALSGEEPKHINERDLAKLVGSMQSVSSPAREAILFAIFTGTRNAELRGVRWQDITQTKHGLVIRIGGQLEEIKTGKYRKSSDGKRVEIIEQRYKPKTKTGRVRFVTLEPIVFEALNHLRAVQESNGAHSPEGFVFLQPPRYAKSNHALLSQWRPISGGYLCKQLKAVCGVVGVPYVSVHGLRHTFVTLTLGEGENTHATQKTVGHSHASTTSDIYAGQTIRAAKIATSAMTQIVERGLARGE